MVTAFVRGISAPIRGWGGLGWGIVPWGEGYNSNELGVLSPQGAGNVSIAGLPAGITALNFLSVFGAANVVPPAIIGTSVLNIVDVNGTATIQLSEVLSSGVIASLTSSGTGNVAIQSGIFATVGINSLFLWDPVDPPADPNWQAVNAGSASVWSPVNTGSAPPWTPLDT